MLRPATPDAIERLVRAAGSVDRELDTALVALGVLPPLDLSEIRSWLTLEGIEVRPRVNGDGHRALDVMIRSRVVATILSCGEVDVRDTLASAERDLSFRR